MTNYVCNGDLYNTFLMPIDLANEVVTWHLVLFWEQLDLYGFNPMYIELSKQLNNRRLSDVKGNDFNIHCHE